MHTTRKYSVTALWDATYLTAAVDWMSEEFYQDIVAREKGYEQK